ncbi:MAG: hypothetical protein Q8M05_04390 [Rhodoferax sp.]|uniref:hypothetical protein n=1 Tax=Rhodoferax sp. TaxID=50421 RepID=UPI00272FD739|nr:hypothetical protein [Rhodoferax sp.]MDP1528600.1 hypothetical protein [Rhodoferax sp.]
MASTEADVETLGLAEFVAAIVEEVAEGAHRSQISQDEDARELAAIAALNPEEVADRLVPLEAAEAYLRDLMEEAGVGADWPKNVGRFLRLVVQRLDIRLWRGREFDLRGLKEAGRQRIIEAARTKLAVDQLDSVRRLLREGAPRIRISGGEFTVKLEIQTRRVAIEAGPVAAAASKVGAARPALQRLQPAERAGRAAMRDVRIAVRPALSQDQGSAAIMGEFKINFMTLG